MRRTLLAGEGFARLLAVLPVLVGPVAFVGEAYPLVVGEHVDRVVVGRAEFGAELTADTGLDVHLADLTDGAGLGVGNERDAVLDGADGDAHLAPAAETLSGVHVGEDLRLALPGPGDQDILHEPKAYHSERAHR